MRRPILVFSLLLSSLWLVVATSAMAHPLGNFTISHHVGLHLQPDTSELTVVYDFAEIPTFQIKREISATTSLSGDQAATVAAARCGQVPSTVELMADGTPLAVRSEDSEIEFLPGEGELETMRITCSFSFDTPSLPSTLAVSNEALPERIGWREIVVTSDGVEIETEAPATSPTDDLREYPNEGASAPLDERTATVRLLGPGPGTGRTVEATEAAPTAPLSLVERIGRSLSPERLTDTPLFVAAAAALGLGFAHAVAPGHGKTLVAAYLVGNRGTWRHAVALGFTVAVSHTVGVAALGAVTFVASSAFTPERIYPYLATLSGVIVAGMGVYLLVRSIRRRREPAEHGHSHDHDGELHSHGGRPHSHAVPTDITWKGLAALGVSGGLVPSASAVVLLLGAVGLGRTGFGLVLVLLFGLGMATALVAAGLLVVGAERVGMRAFGNGSLIERARKVLPIVMALAVLVVGLFLIWNAVQSFA